MKKTNICTSISLYKIALNLILIFSIVFPINTLFQHRTHIRGFQHHIIFSLLFDYIFSFYCTLFYKQLHFPHMARSKNWLPVGYNLIKFWGEFGATLHLSHNLTQSSFFTSFLDLRLETWHNCKTARLREFFVTSVFLISVVNFWFIFYVLHSLIVFLLRPR